MGVVTGLDAVGVADVGSVGGKGASLGELTRIEGLHVPAGFCVTTDALRRVLAAAPETREQLDRLSRVTADAPAQIRALSAEIRDTIEATPIPQDVAAAITDAIAELGDQDAYAVRSSATAEDLPTASFAGQQDSYLDVVGTDAVLRHVSRCWASLFTERAVSYRLHNGFDHRQVQMAVVVQRMIHPHAAGVLFTADPVTGNRKVSAVEAVLGLAEALVSGLLTPDTYAVRDGAIVEVAHATADQPALTDAQVVELEALGRRIERHCGRPQDIEWCLDEDGTFHVVQSRPITTLFPVPEADDDEPHVYVSVGHQQMMTDAMKPLGLSLFQLTAAPRMYDAGGRLFVDVAGHFASPAARGVVLDALTTSDPLMGDALRTVLDRGFVPLVTDASTPAAPPPAALTPMDAEPDQATVDALVERFNAANAAVARDIQTRSGAAVLDFILADLPKFKELLFDPRSRVIYTAAMDAAAWLNEHLETWLGERNAADALTLSVPGNVTAEMGLALLDVADAVRPHPEVIAVLQAAPHGVLDALGTVEGGREAQAAIRGFLDIHGMRCVGEIDITRPRWSERPAALIPLILGNVANLEQGEGERRFEQGRQEALAKEQDVLARLKSLPDDGEQKAAETKRNIDCVRTFMGYREFPKYGIVGRFSAYKQGLMNEAERLADAGVFDAPEDAFFLTFGELHEVARTDRADRELIARRKADFRAHQALTPPRILTSEGEVVTGSYRRDDVPAGALTGLAVSAGTVEGRARVILDVAEADVEPGDILVTAYTDPSWSPLFVAVDGLVTEAGGLMTHGAVVAREYGLPAVVGVVDATKLIADGQRIRVHGADGYVERLD